MKKYFFRFLIVLLLLAGIIGIDRLSHCLRDGFSVTSITSTIPHHEEWDIPIDQEDLDLTQKALAQSYSYLKSGSQCYVFISEDQQFVIKFFKHKRWRLNPFLKAIPLPASLDQKRSRWIRKKKETINSTFQSCIISYEDLKRETGMIYLHLNKSTNLNKKTRGCRSDRIQTPAQFR